MRNELHIFIIWNKGLYLQEPIIDDIGKHLNIRRIFMCSWDSGSFAARLSGLYGKPLPRCCRKEKECGIGDFLVIAAEDIKPEYQDGMNIKILALKYKYRRWFGGGFLIHASDNAKEGEENLKFLTGMGVEEFNCRYPGAWEGTIIQLKAERPLFLPRRQTLYLKFLRGLNMLF